MNKGKRLIPEDLLQYVNDLNEYHPDPEAEWGGGPGGISIRGGTGITVTGADIKTISVNNDVAMKTDLATVATTGDYDDLTNKPTITNVEANPSGVTPTATLTSLEVGSTVYNIPQGGDSQNIIEIENVINLNGYTLTQEQYDSVDYGTIIRCTYTDDVSTQIYNYLIFAKRTSNDYWYCVQIDSRDARNV